MKNKPLFRYSLNFKVFTLSGVFVSFIFIITGILYRFGIHEISLYVWSIFLLLCFILALSIFLYYVTIPLEKISQQMLHLLTGKDYEKIPPTRNDEIGVITHFFNTVTEKITGLSEDISEGRRMSSELEMAAQIQSEVLPKKVSENIIGLDIVAKSRASSEIGGDCFDFIQDDENSFVYIGDVTGHGVPAGLVMMLVSTTIRTLIHEHIPAKSVIVKTNTILKEKISTNHFMSLVMLRWQNKKQRLSFIGAGHEYILHYSEKQQKVIPIKSGGIALKMVLNIEHILKETDIDFHEGDAILLYTDGITEAKNPKGEMYGIERLISVFEKHAGRKAEGIFDSVSDHFAQFVQVNHHQEDDITMIVLKNIGQHSKVHKVHLSIHADETTEYTKKDNLWKWD